MNPKIEQALALLTGCSESDFAELAILAADQAGLGADEQDDLRASLDKALACIDCDRPHDNCTIVSCHGASIGKLCEECHDARLIAAKRRRRDLIEDGRGDYLRDQEKDR